MTIKRVKRYSNEWRKKVSSGWFIKGFTPWNKGVPMREDSKKKLSEAKKGGSAWNKGKKMPEKQKLMLAEVLRGIHRSPKTEFKKGQFSGDKNPSKQLAVRKKISEAKKGKPLLNLRGEKHPNWSGGKTLEHERIRRRIEYKMWRKTIFLRDNWTCQKCKTVGEKLNVHHIFNFADFSGLRISVNNGITLCKSCHKKFHGTFGVKNNTKKKLISFLKT